MIRGYLLVLSAASLWGCLGPLSKYIFSQGVSPMETAFWRAALAWLLFAAHAVQQRQVKVAARDLPAVLLFGAICVSVFYGSYQLAIRHLGAALASVLLYTAPAWVAVMARLFLGEALSPMKVFCVALTVAGVAGVSLDSSFSAQHAATSISVWSVALGLTAGLTYALYYIFGKRFLIRYATPTLFLYALPVGAALMIPLVDFHHKTPQAWIGLFFLAVLSTYGAYSLYYAGLKRLEATRAAVAATIEPVVAAVLAYFWWDETFTPLGYAGSALILAAVLLTVRDARRQSSPRLKTRTE
ncbi:MAG: drug/metabolite transporter, family [Desulfovibrionales bacterium]|nr:drug/metabolite transporter, family [Desulfovibrionales bacterium]